MKRIVAVLVLCALSFVGGHLWSRTLKDDAQTYAMAGNYLSLQTFSDGLVLCQSGRISCDPLLVKTYVAGYIQMLGNLAGYYGLTREDLAKERACTAIRRVNLSGSPQAEFQAHIGSRLRC